MKKLKCKVCGHRFPIQGSTRYLVKDVSIMYIHRGNYHECFDCPACGCQTIVGTCIRPNDVTDDQPEIEGGVPHGTKYV